MERKNPFPGMNPYMEQTWPDVHLRMIGQILDALGLELPDDLMAKGELQVDVFGDATGHPQPDISIVGEAWKGGLPPVWTPAQEYQHLSQKVTEPALVLLEQPKHRWIEIRTAAGDLITVIEIISPANKRRHRAPYVAKRDTFVAAGVNVVEIDLVRGGGTVVDVDDYTPERWIPGGEGYLICVSRAAVWGRREVYACPLRESLPVIRIPLRLHDPDVPLDIQAMVDRCYITGRYWMLDHTRPLDPPLSEGDAIWATEQLRAAGLIGGG